MNFFLGEWSVEFHTQTIALCPGRLGSIAKAAVEVSISQSSITASIDALEASLDYALFVRTPAKGITPTSAG
ncbi:LysR family transcriptional regulator, partial [Planktomarina temperata]|nr:LysR family transcriptional regulator [Planktomarina temperata]